MDVGIEEQYATGLTVENVQRAVADLGLDPDAVGPGDLATVEDFHTLAPLIEKLPERDRLLLRLRFGEELTQAQIGEQLGCSQMHVSRLLSRVVARLRSGLLTQD